MSFVSFGERTVSVLSYLAFSLWVVGYGKSVPAGVFLLFFLAGQASFLGEEDPLNCPVFLHRTVVRVTSGKGRGSVTTASLSWYFSLFQIEGTGKGA